MNATPALFIDPLLIKTVLGPKMLHFGAELFYRAGATAPCRRLSGRPPASLVGAPPRLLRLLESTTYDCSMTPRFAGRGSAGEKGRPFFATFSDGSVGEEPVGVGQRLRCRVRRAGEGPFCRRRRRPTIPARRRDRSRRAAVGCRSPAIRGSPPDLRARSPASDRRPASHLPRSQRFLSARSRASSSVS